MRNQRFWRTVLNIVLGGMVLMAAVISYDRAFSPDTPYYAPYFYLVGLLSWVLASFLFISKPDADVAHFSYLMSVGLMSICSVNGVFSPGDQGWQSKFVPLFQFAATAFLPCVFFRCFAVFPSAKRFAMNRFFRWWVYIPALLLFVAMSVSYLAGNGYERLFFLIKIPRLNILTVLNLTCLFAYSIAGHGCLLHTWLSGETALQRGQAKWLFIGISIGTIPVAVFDTVPRLVGIPIPHGGLSAYTLVMIMVCYAVAILKYGLLNIEFMLNRSSVYAVVSGVMLVVYLASIYVLSAISSGPKAAVKLFSMLIVALLFAPMKQRIEEFIERHFYQRRYEYRQTLLNLAAALSTILGLDELGEALLGQLNTAFQPEFAALLLEDDSEYQVYTQVGDAKKLSETLREFDPGCIESKPEKLEGSQLAVPLLSKGNCVGVILLGRKLSGKDYNAEDISLMEMSAINTAVFMEKAVIYERLRERIDSMQSAHSRLVETFRGSYPDLIPEEPVPMGEDIVSDLDTIAEALVRISEKLGKLDALRLAFLSAVSHEFNTTLGIIKGSADNLLDGVSGKLNEKQQQYMEATSRNSERLIRMVENILDHSRIIDESIEFSPTELSPSSLINDVIFELALTAEKKGVSLSLNSPSDTMLFADEDKLKQIIINLLYNAIKFTPPEGEVSAYVEDKGEYVDITIADTGIGIPPESLDEIFERFHQVQQEDSGKRQGVGLGLAIVKDFVELHDGSISVQSELGKGSLFTVTLPIGGKK
ncbi:ATP-binding protein [Candidatus Poribacteria bacterium]